MFFIHIFQLSLSTEKRQLNYENLAGYRRTKDLVPLFDPKVQFFQNSTGKLNILIVTHVWCLYLFYYGYYIFCVLSLCNFIFISIIFVNIDIQF